MNEVAPVDVILCDDLELDSNIAMASTTASVNYLGRFPWQSKARSLFRHFKKSALSLTIERFVRVALPRNWDYEVDRGVSRSISKVLDRSKYLLTVGRYLKPIVKTGLVGRMSCLLDIDDVDFDIFAQRAEDLTRPQWQRLLYSAQSSQIKAAFHKWLPQFNGLWVTKAGDRRHLVSQHAAILPNIPYHAPTFTASLKESISETPVILTVGVLSYLPNRDGIDRFIREGWPKVRSACPTAEYWLAGENDPAMARRWQTVPGVKVLGYVDDLAAVYDASWFTLCPLWSGGGTNIKVLESLAFGRTCVATVVGHRGYEDCLRAGVSLLVATNAEDLAQNCIQLINDRARRDALAKRGQEVVRREFSYENFASVVHREIDRALGKQFRACDS
ncbi:MAG: glycosyltransferase family 4 protein [Verrucomicrobia bacterium]|nr:glycosyltransferase family 4 protein [Verrucomicrobiota bacterium]